MSPSRSIANKLCKIAENMVLTWIDSHFVCDITQILTRRLSECTETGEHFFEIQSTRRNWSKAQHRTKKSHNVTLIKETHIHRRNLLSRRRRKNRICTMNRHWNCRRQSDIQSRQSLFSAFSRFYRFALFMPISFSFGCMLCGVVVGPFFCSHRDLLITVFCAGKLMFVQKAWT